MIDRVWISILTIIGIISGLFLTFGPEKDIAWVVTGYFLMFFNLAVWIWGMFFVEKTVSWVEKKFNKDK